MTHQVRVVAFVALFQVVLLDLAPCSIASMFAFLFERVPVHGADHHSAVLASVKDRDECKKPGFVSALQTDVEVLCLILCFFCLILCVFDVVWCVLMFLELT